ncbi:MAG: hypothetical protein IK085_00095, partial [Clostridia bacterium]|nr:hypothetical protein [Clostridia bacterium]
RCSERAQKEKTVLQRPVPPVLVEQSRRAFRKESKKTYMSILRPQFSHGQKQSGVLFPSLFCRVKEEDK